MTIERIKTNLIYLLLLLLVACLFIIWKQHHYSETKDDLKSDFLFTRGVPDSVAWAHMDRYRSVLTFRKKARGVWYDTSSVLNYLRDTFPHITNQITLPDHCRWVLGFYFMRKVDKESNHTQIPKLDFYVVPTIYNYSVDSIYDFSDPKYQHYYVRNGKRILGGSGGDTTSFDAGHLWP